MDTQRWLVEYDETADVRHFEKTAPARGVRIVGVYPDALALIAEASEKNFQSWVAVLSLRGTRANAYPEEEIRQEENIYRLELMKYWNQYLATSFQKSHPHEGLSWDHPGFSPPDRPGINSGNNPDQ